MGNFGPSNTFETRRLIAEERNAANEKARTSVCWNNTVSSDMRLKFCRDGEPTIQEYWHLFAMEEAQCPEESVPKWYQIARDYGSEQGQSSLEERYRQTPLASMFPVKRTPTLVESLQRLLLPSLTSPTDGLDTDVERDEQAANNLLRILNANEVRTAMMVIESKWKGKSGDPQEYKELAGVITANIHTITSTCLAFELVQNYMKSLARIEVPEFMKDVCENEMHIARIVRYQVACAGINTLRDLKFMKRCTDCLVKAYAQQRVIRQVVEGDQFFTLVDGMGEDEEPLLPEHRKALSHLVKLITDARKWIICEGAFGMVSECVGALAELHPIPRGNHVDPVYIHRAMVNVLLAQEEDDSGASM